MSPQTYDVLLRQAVRDLSDAGIDGAPRDARLLLAHVLGMAPGRLSVVLPDQADPAHIATLAPLIQGRANGKPVSHILGRKAFWNGEFEVTPDTLSPRPDTETLIEQALKRESSTILDLGTGTGCIAISLLQEWPRARAVACDISTAALDVAARNGVAHGVAERLTLVASDWFGAVTGRFDLIVSNPPYIAVSEMAGLSREVRAHDPQLALTDGGDGLGCYRVIVAQAADHLVPNGRLMVEIGAKQGAAVQALFAQAGFGDISCTQDMEGRDRVVAGTAPQPR